ncbi:membrane protein YqaA, SNARE-associated domain [Geoalkalibacter ferrihydriticus]|uniref:Cytochrome B561 n=2 Tax=Geoalkalibacter ferrihydriticus TaxID=392333 RepID=A0A0C2EFL3_9BACT|nr:VTT domain-containing protein [Geoalkalibacter ferrihydriticus]KIH77403.1 cytochrome B561 [Geoalkalibacter ferrihydriticus DSM 17813]SDM16533.1 membrane protein YqaA, SNARE-associated domain [Geoalkalibacter ferrihydriticus]
MFGLRRLYDWVLSWAQTPYGGIALFFLAFAESSFFPIPPDVLLIALALSLPTRAFRFAFLAACGSVLGGLFGYLLGFGMWHALDSFFYTYIPGFSPEGFVQVQELFERYNFWVVFSAGFTPVPYKLITVGAGVFHINVPIFVLASVVSRSLRFFLVAWFIYRFGPPVRVFIEKYFNFLALVFFILLVAGVWVVKYLV